MSDLPDTPHVHRVCLPLLPSPRFPDGELRFAPVLTDPDPITHILAHIGEPTSPPLLHPARGPPQTEFSMGPGSGAPEESARESFPDDLDQTPRFDPAEPEPTPEDDLDQTWNA